MADEVNDILHALARDGYVDEVSKIRVFLEDQGEVFVDARKANAKINSALSRRLETAEKTLKANGLPVPPA